MPIMLSTFYADEPDADGYGWMTEQHVDQLGKIYDVQYFGLVGGAAGRLAERATELSAEIKANEIRANLSLVVIAGSVAAVTFSYSTVAQNAAVFRDAYASLEGVSAVMLGDYLATLTDGQLQTAFGMDAGQVTDLRADKLTPAVAAAATIRATTGA